MTRRTGLGLDPFLTSYVATLREVLEPLRERTVLDVSAGSGWARQIGFAAYSGLDVNGEHEYWDLDTPVPDHHVGRYDLALNLGSIHYARDPHRSFSQMLRTLRPQGDLVLMAPWMFPPHDRRIDRWRLAPVAVWELLAPHFAEVDLYCVGNVFQLPAHVLKRIVAGPFHGVDAATLAGAPRRKAAPRLTIRSADDVPARWTGPVNVVVHGRGHLRAGDS